MLTTSEVNVTSNIYGRNVYLYNASHKLSPYVQRVVLHHVEGHGAHHQHMLLVVQVHTATAHRERTQTNTVGGTKLRLK